MTDAANRKVAGDVDYARHGPDYARIRQTDARIAGQVHQALGDARTILNVGAGAGSYEPLDRYVLAIEPSETMRAQRPKHLAPAIHGIAEQLPLDDQSVDASMALVTVHQWRNLDKGLRELRRVTRGPIVVLTFDGDALDRYWLAEYAPELISVERRRYPGLKTIADGLGGPTEVQVIPIPIDCVDGFTEAYYARPEAFLDFAVRRSQSGWSFVLEDDQSRFVKALGDDLTSGAWDRKFGEWRTKPYFEGSLRLIVSQAIGRN
jgi:SAM-dependent methyltransferase